MKINVNGKAIELDSEALKKAMEEGKDTFDVQADVVLRTAEEDKLFKDNTLKEGRSTGIEIGRKEVLKGVGIEADGVHKSIDTSLEALTSWGNKIKEEAAAEFGKPNEKIEEYKKDIDTLKMTIGSLQSEKESVLNDFSTYKKTERVKSTLSSLIPDNVVIPKGDMLTILSNKMKVDVDESGNVFAVGSDGQPLKNSTTLEPLPIQEVVGNFFSENQNYLKSVDGGANGGDSHRGSAKQSIEDFTKEMIDAGNAPNSEAFNTQMMERVKAGTLDV